MSDDRTLAVYNRQTDDYVAMMDQEAAKDPMIRHFIATCSDGGDVLDLGCGAGHYARRMAEAGLIVSALDASESMIEHAAAIPGVSAQLGRFEDVSGENLYNGIWAYFSLLHAPRQDLPDHLFRIATALRPGGVFFIGMKRGSGGKRDKLDRFYEYYEQVELEALLRNAGLNPVNHWLGKAEGLAGNPEGWIVIEAHG
ncbi:Cypemycin methyltransferase [Roseovarius albus]|uniref:Cypemycin methyltransferase n=1 Tax=Roseovarius albus TaxID=1247867 RepID=A0A1X6YJ81_9RHOB|nr:class I SAM-dependent methyltransferase [Roseovarius albus]SLN22701.1 Cypemycin methyltransferase [Roseovarius albus]